MFLVRSSLLVSAILFAACNSKVTSGGNAELQKQIQTLTDCFPNLFKKVEGLLEVAETWRLNTGSPAADPTGLTFSGLDPIVVGYTADGITLSMSIRFYAPDGTEQTGLSLTGTSLAERLDSAATALRTSFPGGSPFLVGDWTLNGSGFSGSGALTGMLGGVGSDNELEQLRTTTATPVGGPPPAAASTITEGACTLTFRTDDLAIDSFPAQQYPTGTMTVTVDGDDADAIADVTATVTFDNTPVVLVESTDPAPLRFALDVETRAFTSVP